MLPEQTEIAPPSTGQQKDVFPYALPPVVTNRKDRKNKTTHHFHSFDAENERYFIPATSYEEVDRLYVVPLTVTKRCMVWSNGKSLFESPLSYGPVPGFTEYTDKARIVFYDIERKGYYCMDIGSRTNTEEADWLQYMLYQDMKKGIPPYAYAYTLFSHPVTFRKSTNTNYYIRFQRTGDINVGKPTFSKAVDGDEGPEYKRELLRDVLPDLGRELEDNFESETPSKPALAVRLSQLNSIQAANAIRGLQRGELTPGQVMEMKPEVWRKEV